MGKAGKTSAPKLGSKQWSCSELEESNETLLGAKEEIDEEAEQKIKEPIAFDLGYIVLTTLWYYDCKVPIKGYH